MSPVHQIELAVAQLSPEELAEFRRWFAEFYAEAGYGPLEKESGDGHVDGLAEDTLRDLGASHSMEF